MNLIKVKRQQEVFLKEHTSLGIGGISNDFFVAQTIDELRQILATINSDGRSYHFMGAGSNLLVTDREIKNPVISLGKKFSYLKKIDPKSIRVGAATRLSQVVKYLIKENLSGLEGLAGIPASIGGLIAMNGSGYGSAISSCLDEVLVITNQGDLSKIKKSDMVFSYRKSSLNNCIILEAVFNFQEASGIKKLIEKNIRKRMVEQDFFYPSAGCVFRNPENKSAGALIESCNLKGCSVGGAQVSKSHANFIINKGNASFDDVVKLIKIIRKRVYDKFGILLEEEIIRWEN